MKKKDEGETSGSGFHHPIIIFFCCCCCCCWYSFSLSITITCFVLVLGRCCDCLIRSSTCVPVGARPDEDGKPPMK